MGKLRVALFAIAVLALVGAALATGGCQKSPAASKARDRAEAAGETRPVPPTATAEAEATATPLPVQPVAPAPSGNPGVPLSEQDAASRVIPIFPAIVPKGPRKPPPARLFIPTIGVDAKVIPLGTHYNEAGELVWDTAPFAVGHHQGTANPGEVGNVVLSGHISSLREGAVFSKLPDIQIGDGVIVITADRNYIYQVIAKQVVEPTQVEVMNSTGEFTLTMITCVPDGIYTHRLVVTAKQV